MSYKHIHAYTEVTYAGAYPAYVSVKEGENLGRPIELSVRSTGGSQAAFICLTEMEASSLAHAILDHVGKPERDEWVSCLVQRFLGWPLPKTFSPDCGISFDGRKDDEFNKGKTWPVGTNLLTAVEARAMFEHALGVK